jgi:hypothetical protein
MGTLEIINMLASTIFGAFMTMWKNGMDDKKAERENYLKIIKEQREETNAARTFEGVPITEQNRIKTYTRKWVIFGKEFSYYKSSNDSGKYRSETGFHITRRVIALLCVLSIIVLPIVLPVFYDITITFGYVENFRALLPWRDDIPVIKWIVVGNAERNIVITPIMNNIIINIIGMFFGNQISKR